MELTNYKVGQVLGSGSFGEVRVAVEKATGRKVAVKAIALDQVTNISEVERVSREFFILTALDHKNVIRLYEVLQSDAHLYLILEFAGGGSLDSYLTKIGGKCADEKGARKMFSQILSAVRYCHRKRVIHRDLKPENILLSTNGQVKVADFGLSSSVSYGVRARSPVGTPLYAAPEVLFPQMYPELDALFDNAGAAAVESAAREGRRSRTGSFAPEAGAHERTGRGQGEGGGDDTALPADATDVDGEVNVASSCGSTGAGASASPVTRGQYTPGVADVWSLGVILHRLVFGALPHTASTIRELKHAIFDSAWSPPGACSPALASLLRGMLQKDPLSRMTSEQTGAA